MYKKSKAFTLVELLVVVAIIGILSSVVISSMNSARLKARDAKRAQDFKSIYTALVLYQDKYGCLPITNSSSCPGAATYSEYNTGGFDNSNEGGFLTFLVTNGFISSAPIDPINNSNNYYRYFCYTNGLNIGYLKESSNSWVTNPSAGGGWYDNNFICK